MEPGEVRVNKVDRVERTPLTEDVKEILKQSRMVLEQNKKILDVMSRPSQWIVDPSQLSQDFKDSVKL